MTQRKSKAAIDVFVENQLSDPVPVAQVGTSEVEVKNDSGNPVAVSSTPNPYSAKTGRTHITALLENQTADALLYTVTPGKILRVTSVVVGIINTSSASGGRVVLRDGTTAAGTIRIPILAPNAGAGILASAVGNVTTPVYFGSEPFQFATGIFVDILAGTITYSLSMNGYEE